MDEDAAGGSTDESAVGMTVMRPSPWSSSPVAADVVLIHLPLLLLAGLLAVGGEAVGAGAQRVERRLRDGRLVLVVVAAAATFQVMAHVDQGLAVLAPVQVAGDAGRRRPAGVTPASYDPHVDVEAAGRERALVDWVATPPRAATSCPPSRCCWAPAARPASAWRRRPPCVRAGMVKVSVASLKVAVAITGSSSTPLMCSGCSVKPLAPAMVMLWLILWALKKTRMFS